MKGVLSLSLSLFIYLPGTAQHSAYTIDDIMRDPKWIGVSPSQPYWTTEGSLIFSWNPDHKLSDSLYYITSQEYVPKKLLVSTENIQAGVSRITYNNSRTAYVFESDGDLFYKHDKNKNIIRITITTDTESQVVFTDDHKIGFIRNLNAYEWNSADGSTRQLTNIIRTNKPSDEKLTEQEQWLKENQLATSEVIRYRKARRDSVIAAQSVLKKKNPFTIYVGEQDIQDLRLSPGGRYVTYKLTKLSSGRRAIITDYVTESGFTQSINVNQKVGAPQNSSRLFIGDLLRDTVIEVRTNKLPGSEVFPAYMSEYKTSDSIVRERQISVTGPYWNNEGKYGVLEVRSSDNKNRWLMLLDPSSATVSLLHHDRDEAWIGGPGILLSSNSWIDEQTLWFQSESTGFSHLYTINIKSGKKKMLTEGNYEIVRTILSSSKKHFYITTNEEHPGEHNIYRLPVNGGVLIKLTTMKGGYNNLAISPDEKKIAYLYSSPTKPWELYIQENHVNSKAVQITSLAASDKFKSFQFREPEVVTFTARDGKSVYARLYKPLKELHNRPAVIFVHGAGYLQNAHKWWSDYFREFMFHNFLTENGYTVLDIDYRGSAGYGRDWRTGIYRHMGGKDLTDQVDGARYLVEKLNINKKNIGIYGGSYGGFITLMAMFTHQEIFTAGAALRSVTDWAHYNHGYTSNILNTPYLDSIAYKRSSPIYFAEGLKGALLMCHGMVDTNVHFQDIVRLTQRLIELKKENWELAVYPVENHAFTEPSSWIDEYKRIYKLFQTNLKN